jgi:hypothetical protein
MRKDKTSVKAMHHSSGGRKIPVSAAARAAARALPQARPTDSSETMHRTGGKDAKPNASAKPLLD